MVKNNPELIGVLRQTADRLASGARYEWGHMGRCNCGHLVQTITNMTDHEIAQSVDFELDEWSEYAKDYCEGSGHKVDDLFIILEDVGFSYQDVIHLENLSDMRVLDRLEGGRRYLQRNRVEDVTLYMQTLADMLEEELCV
jgi:hypothetical protein